ncbi:MAG: hypothetical protein LBG95_04760 [Treponema sp.]|jgi:tetratricopeptide (TPR) repeat protein|nr:hypothetical protein [Treponema sp.]
MRKRAEVQLNLGNKQADQGNFNNALILLNEALRLAVVTDDPGLRIRARLSRSNALFSSGYGDEARAGWNKALSEAEEIGNSGLAAVCRIHIERGKLLSPEGKSSAQSVRDAVNRDLGLIKQDRYYAAFAWMVISRAEKELGRYGDAEAAARRSLDIHEKDRYFELAAYDWFMIASFRSLAADYRGARQALENALAFDRRVENSWGLASDWHALGDVQAKAGDRPAARAAYQRAAEIYRALGNDETAEQILAKIE